jgi:hypothetical protein
MAWRLFGLLLKNWVIFFTSSGHPGFKTQQQKMREDKNQ